MYVYIYIYNIIIIFSKNVIIIFSNNGNITSVLVVYKYILLRFFSGNITSVLVVYKYTLLRFFFMLCHHEKIVLGLDECGEGEVINHGFPEMRVGGEPSAGLNLVDLGV